MDKQRRQLIPARINRLIEIIKASAEPITAYNVDEWLPDIAFAAEPELAACPYGFRPHACEHGLGKFLGIPGHGDPDHNLAACGFTYKAPTEWRRSVISAAPAAQKAMFIRLLNVVAETGRFEYDMTHPSGDEVERLTGIKFVDCGGMPIAHSSGAALGMPVGHDAQIYGSDIAGSSVA